MHRFKSNSHLFCLRRSSLPLSVKTLFCCFVALCLSACLSTQDHYYEHNTVHFSNGSSISETRHANYPPYPYYPSNIAPINAAISVSGTHGAAAIAMQSPHSYPPPYPPSNIRTYSDGNTSITRGTYYPSNCQQRYTRHGKTYYRTTPCYP